MNFETMGTSALLERRTAIGTELEAEGADLDALEAEVKEINEELEKRKAAAAKQAEIRRMVANGEGKVLQTMNMEERKMDEIHYTADSAEYRSGFLKAMLHKDMTEEETRATSYVATTGDVTYGAGYLIPTTMVNAIWDMVEKNNPILGDITMYRTNTILSIPVRTGISQGDAKSVSENAANDDEINAFTTVTLNGKDFSKHFDLSYAMAQMSIDAFEGYLVSEISDRIGEALGLDVVTQILADYDDVNNAVETASVGTLTFADVASAFAKLKNGKGNVVIYASNATIYNRLVGMVDDNGRPIFQISAQQGAAGYLIGAPIKVQSGIADDVLLIGYPQTVVGNTVHDIMVESDRDIKKHVITYSGYARFECKLVASKAFATLTVQEQD